MSGRLLHMSCVESSFVTPSNLACILALILPYQFPCLCGISPRLWSTSATTIPYKCLPELGVKKIPVKLSLASKLLSATVCARQLLTALPWCCAWAVPNALSVGGRGVGVVPLELG